MLKCSITIDVDSLNSIFKGKNLLRKGGYSYLEYELGFQHFLEIFNELGIKATFFVVGQDLDHAPNQEIIRQVYNTGHEIANHTMHHAQGFRLLSPGEKNEQLELCENRIEKTIGKKPVGFRSPGWNIGDEAVQLLIKRNYRYDSSVFPTSLMPLLKLLHYTTMNSRSGLDRTTMGQLDYMFASPRPYQSHPDKLRKKGNSGFYELPVSVTPLFRIPFFATFLLSTGINIFRMSYELIKMYKRPIIYLFHLFDFVDFSHPDFDGQIPDKKGIYMPSSILVPFEKKFHIFREALSIIAKDYTFMTLEELRESL